jgi:hypothetical protein
MSTRRNTFEKRERERAKRTKAEHKRAKRLEKNTDEPDDAETEVTAAAPIDQSTLLAELAALHRDHDDEKIAFDEFEERKAAIMEQLDI